MLLRVLLGPLSSESLASSCSAATETCNQVMRVLGLWKERNSLIGEVHGGGARGLSGGQRKRVNVAMELVLQPSVR